MYRLIHSMTFSTLFKRQVPVFLMAFIIAELFYKFHSFTLECAAFLITWYVLDALNQKIFGGQTADPARPLSASESKKLRCEPLHK